MKKNIFIAIVLTIVTQASLAAKSKKSTSFESAYGSSSISDKKSSDQFRVSGGALSALVGILSVKGEYFLNNKFALGADISYTSKQTEPLDKDTSTKSYHLNYSEYNLGLNYMITGTNTSDGFYINSKVGSFSTSISEFTEENLGGAVSASQFVVTGGYHWVYPTKFQLTLGLGGRATQASDIVIYDSAKKELYRTSASLNSAVIDCSLAYTF